MKVSSNQLLLALRAPNSTWLAALVCALDEALQDPAFGEPQRALVRGLLDAGNVPVAVANAAHERLAQFEHALEDLDGLFAAASQEALPVAVPRPKLSLCGSAA